MNVRNLLIASVLLLLTGCTGTPDKVTPVSGFELDRYLGTWYEIARLPHPFEEGLSKVTATYSLQEDGGVKVVNRGFNSEAGEYEEAVGKAYFVGDATVGHLKVSFFGPFYASYVVMDLDKTNYQYSLVTGPDKDYLWILARTPTLDEAIKTRLVEEAKTHGYDISKLQFIDQ